MTSAGPIIELVGVERRFTVGEETVAALRGIDLTLAPGEYLAVTGPSGSGKSTLLHTIGLLDRPDAGQVWIAGCETTVLDDEKRAALRRERIGFVFQFFHLVPRLTARDNVELPLLLAGVPARERHRRSEALLAQLGLAERAGHRPDQLSGGQRQRVAIARAVISRPSVLLADEPTGNLDRRSGREVMAILERLRQEEGLTLVVVTHDPELAGRAPRRIRMVDGAVVADERKG